jgi:hypothetical protein
MERRKPVGLTCAVAAAIATMAFAVPSASATRVTPAGTTVTATLKSSTKLKVIPSNAFSTLSVACLGAEATFTTPPENEHTENMNRGPEEPYEEGGPEGTYSESPGSVIAAIEGKPTFKECGIYSTNEEGKETLVASAEVQVKEGWSVSGFAFGVPEEEEAGTGLIGAMISFPPEAVVMKAAGCEITVSPSQADAVHGEYVNGSHELVIDGQLAIKKSGIFCTGIESPAQYEARYTVSNELEITR